MPTTRGWLASQTRAPAAFSDFAICQAKPPSSATPVTNAFLPERSSFNMPELLSVLRVAVNEHALGEKAEHDQNTEQERAEPKMRHLQERRQPQLGEADAGRGLQQHEQQRRARQKPQPPLAMFLLDVEKQHQHRRGGHKRQRAMDRIDRSGAIEPQL